MKTFKHLITVLMLTGAMNAMAQGNVLEMSRVRAIDSQKTEITFLKKVEGGTKTITAIDDDGMLTLTAIQFNMMQAHAETLFKTGRDESPEAASKLWGESKDKLLRRYSAVKPSILNSLQKLAAYTSVEVKQMKARLARLTDRAEIADLQAKISVAEEENAKANELHKFFSGKEAITLAEMSKNLGAFLAKRAAHHLYLTQVNGGEAQVLPLVDANSDNPLGYLFYTRPLELKDDVLKQQAHRGNLELAANVLKDLEKATENAKVPEGHLTPAATRTMDSEFIEP